MLLSPMPYSFNLLRVALHKYSNQEIYFRVLEIIPHVVQNKAFLVVFSAAVKKALQLFLLMKPLDTVQISQLWFPCQLTSRWL